MAKQEFDNNDRGYFAKNDDREHDRAPSHKGKLTISQKTLKGLLSLYQDEGEAVLYIAGWPSKKAGMLSLVCELPREYRDGGKTSAPKRGRDRDEESPQRGRRSSRRDEEDDFDDDVPF